MLERVHVENYKCLRDVTVDLGKLTILIGANDSGKSSFLDVLKTLGEIVRLEFREIFRGDKSLENLVWRRDANRNIGFEVTGQTLAGRFDYRVEIPIFQQQHFEKLKTENLFVFDTQQTPSIMVGKQSVNFRPGITLVAEVVNQPGLDGAKNIRGFANSLASTIEFHFDPEKARDANPSLTRRVGAAADSRTLI
jgi:ABC-type phosphate/phosphonate transport system ATPase subunit